MPDDNRPDLNADGFYPLTDAPTFVHTTGVEYPHLRTYPEIVVAVTNGSLLDLDDQFEVWLYHNAVAIVPNDLWEMN